LRSWWTLDPDVRFLNHGSFGACPTPVLAAQAEWRARLEREPVLFLHRELEGHLDAAREELAAFVGSAPQDLVFVPNATIGVNTVLRSLELEPGDELLVTDHGYNACRNAADEITERAGARTVVAQLPFPVASPDEVVAAILERAGPRTRLALIDHITSPTGLVLPIERITAELAERGIDTLVDGAHALGMLPLDLERLGAAYFTGNAHKWCCAPKGAAVLFVRRDRQATMRPYATSHGRNSPRTDRSRFLLEADWTGTYDPTAFLSIPAALRFLGDLFPGGWEELRRTNRALVLRGRELLCAALGTAPPAPESMIGSLASVELPLDPRVDVQGPFALDPVHTALFEHHRIEVPVMHWPSPKLRLLRISAQAYNTEAEMQALADVLPAVLRETADARGIEG